MVRQTRRQTRIGNYQFDSIAEAERYLQLLAMEQAGDIQQLRVHPQFVLQQSCKRVSHGKRVTIRAITYTADFMYIENGVTVVEDVKGTRRGKPFVQREARLRHKLLQYQHPEIDFRLIAM